MNKKLNFKKKIDLLLISLEALDLYALEDLNNYYSMPHEREYIFLIRSGNYTRHPSKNSLCEFEDSIKAIYTIQHALNDSFRQNIIFNILNNYNKNAKAKLNTQYIKRFKYIYEKTQDYYSNYSYYINVNIVEVAIINLYIMSKIKTKNGIYLFIKYLYSY